MGKVDLKGAVDHLSHSLIVKARRQHTDGKGSLRYSERGLTAPLHSEDGRHEARTTGTAQGGVVSPLLLTLVLP